MDDIVSTLIARAGSQLKAASMIGVTSRNVQSWCCGHSAPNKESRSKIMLFLEGDQADAREFRINGYEARAAEGAPLFG